MRRTELRGTDPRRADLRRADLRRTDLRGTRLRGTHRMLFPRHGGNLRGHGRERTTNRCLRRYEQRIRGSGLRATDRVTGPGERGGTSIVRGPAPSRGRIRSGIVAEGLRRLRGGPGCEPSRTSSRRASARPERLIHRRAARPFRIRRRPGPRIARCLVPRETGCCGLRVAGCSGFRVTTRRPLHPASRRGWSADGSPRRHTPAGARRRRPTHRTAPGSPGRRRDPFRRTVGGDPSGRA
ncbi:pentapeptide repeat-containing protein [Actinoplanes xinjiangensis]|uniref:pentapeptide repeat-containing protein n=1 Tax=Actinoplanes xinjiangensis TaxID=512350 RepID=UPI0035A21F1C